MFLFSLSLPPGLYAFSLFSFLLFFFFSITANLFIKVTFTCRQQMDILKSTLLNIHNDTTSTGNYKESENSFCIMHNNSKNSLHDL